jgi:TolB protein
MSIRPHLVFVAAFLATTVTVPTFAQEELYLELTRPGLRRVAVAAPPLLVLPGTPVDIARSFQEVLDNDLVAAAPISIVDRRLYSLVEEDARPELVNQRWRSIGAQFLLSGTIVRAGGQLVVEARLVDLVSGEFAFAKRYRSGISSATVVAHTLANDIVQVFTGRPGPFLSRIAFVSDRSGHAELWVMDWDGQNPRQLTKHASIALGPAWSPDGERLAFTSYLRGRPALYLLKPSEGYLRLLFDQGGVNSSPSFSPDGEQLAIASSNDGNVDIYSISAEGGDPTRLTTARAIDTQPSWSPNGRQIAFTSTRAGTPQIYLMDKDGTNVRRLSFGSPFHDEPAWALDGTRIVCTTKVDGKFQLATIDIVNGERIVLAGPGNNESPSFAPDGSMVAFSSDRSGDPQIFVTDAEGRPRQLTREGKNHSPAWIGMDKAQ